MKSALISPPVINLKYIRCPKAKNGETTTIIGKTITTIGTSTNLDTTEKYKTACQQEMGTKGEKHQDHPDTQVITVYSHAKFSDAFFRQFDLGMKLKKEELKKQGKVESEVSKVTEGDLIEAFGVTKDQMMKSSRNTSKRQEDQKFRKLIGLTSKRLWT